MTHYERCPDNVKVLAAKIIAEHHEKRGVKATAVVGEKRIPLEVKE
jgi:hypothetical protein